MVYTPDPRFIELISRPAPLGGLVGQELVGARSQYNTIRYTVWPGSLAMKLLMCAIPENFKKGDRLVMNSIPVMPCISMQLIKHIGEDLMIAKSEEGYKNQCADAHWIMTDGCLFDLKRGKWLTW